MEKKAGELIKEGDVLKELKRVGVNPRAIPIMLPKGIFRRIKLYKIRNSMASILKQEALAVGADVAVHNGCVACRVSHSDVLIMGTMAQLRKLVEKMRYNVAESKDIAKEIETILKKD